VEVPALVGLSAKAVSERQAMLSNSVTDWFIHNSSLPGGPGKFVGDGRSQVWHNVKDIWLARMT